MKYAINESQYVRGILPNKEHLNTSQKVKAYFIYEENYTEIRDRHVFNNPEPMLEFMNSEASLLM